MKLALLIFSMLCLNAVSAFGQGAVRPANARATVLQNGERALDFAAKLRQTELALPENPFVAWVDPETRRPLPTGPVAEAPPPRVRLSESEALEAIAARLRPTGSLIGPQTAFINLPGGNRLERGQRFDAEIHGESYSVLVEDISPQSYTLRLGEATVTRSFLSDRMGTGTIIRTPGAAPSNPSPQPPDN